MMKRLFTIFLALVIFGLSGNSVYARKVKALSQLERREVETRFYDTADTMKVMKAAANTLQDSGFVIQEIEPELGYMRAQKTFKKRFMNKGRVVGQSFLLALYTTYTVFTYGSTAYYMVDPSRKTCKRNPRKKLSLWIQMLMSKKFGKNKTKVRFVLVEKVLQNADGYSYVKSAPARIIRIYKPEVYQEFFAQLDKSIFYEGI